MKIAARNRAQFVAAAQRIWVDAEEMLKGLRQCERDPSEERIAQLEGVIRAELERHHQISDTSDRQGYAFVRCWCDGEWPCESEQRLRAVLESA